MFENIYITNHCEVTQQCSYCNTLVDMFSIINSMCTSCRKSIMRRGSSTGKTMLVANQMLHESFTRLPEETQKEILKAERRSKWHLYRG